MIPGITSFCAAAAVLGQSLTGMDQPLHIYPGASGDLDTTLELPGTKVLMESGRAVSDTASVLSHRGLAGNAAMVADCGLPTQRVFEVLTQPPKDAGTFCTVIVPEPKKVVRKK